MPNEMGYDLLTHTTEKEVLGLDYVYAPPEEVMWQGVYHPDAGRTFDEIEEYLQWYKPKESKNTVGILFNRRYWENKDLEIIDSLIRELEKEYSTIPVFCHGIGDVELGSRPDREVIEEFLLGRIDALINLQSVFNLGDDAGSVDVLKRLDVPVFHPLMAYHATEDEWNADLHGLGSTEIGWSVAMPEFEGVIEPIIIGVATPGEAHGTEFEMHTA
ncbi:MAG: cobaltochelatase subunit CobN, partial [Methanosarcinales archaeon]|nr:cobaltochelatase subunit CobN [Methanosarcinales archaeon]